jgi:hypothetical protein
MKTELEETAANLADPNLDKTDNWIAGAKWQQERMYSEEEVDKLLDTLLHNNMCSVAGDELIKQFKKK